MDALLGGAGSEAAAEAEAIKRICSLLPSSELLPRVPQFRSELVKKRETVSVKLSTLVQTQLSETAYALELLDGNVKRSVHVRDQFKSLVQQCKDCNQLFSEKDYPSIRAIKTARRNLETSLKLFTMYEDIPTKASKLSKMLDSKKISLKDAFLEIRRLFRIKDKAHLQGDKNAGKFLDLFEQSFQSVRDVASQLEREILKVIEECVDIGAEQPALLVSALQIIEMEDNAKRYKVFDGKPLAGYAIQKGAQRVTMREKVFQTLEKSIGDFFANAFHDAPPDEDEGASPKSNDMKPDRMVAQGLKVGKKVVNDLQFVDQYVVPCFPPSYDILIFFESRYTRWFSSRLINVIGDVSQLTSGTLLDCLKFIGDYKRGLSAIGIEKSNEVKLLDETQEQTMKSFLAFQQKKLSMGFQNIFQSNWSEDPKRVNDMHWVTSAPLDMFTLINTLVASSAARLQGAPFVEVVKICLNNLKDYQNKHHKAIEVRGVEQKEEFIVAVINDCNLCQENLAGVQEKVMDHIRELEGPEAEDFEVELEEAFESTVDGFVKVGNRASFVLVDQMLKLIHSTLFTELFNEVWFNDKNSSAAKSIIVTFTDFFLDYQAAIAASFYFCTVLKHSLSLLVADYIESFIQSEPNIEAPEIFAQVASDAEVFREGFSDQKWNEFIPRKFVEEKIDYITQIKSLLESEPGFLSLYYESIHMSYGPKGVDFLTKVLALRSDMNSKAQKAAIQDYLTKYPTDNAETLDQPSPNMPRSPVGKMKKKDGGWSFWGNKKRGSE